MQPGRGRRHSPWQATVIVRGLRAVADFDFEMQRALMNRPALLLLDEPSLGLSPILVKEIFTIIKRVNEEQGMSILLVEQNAKVALETAHYGYVLEIGRVVMNDTCERLMNSKDIQEFYLGAKEESARGERRWKKKKTWR